MTRLIGLLCSTLLLVTAGCASSVTSNRSTGAALSASSVIAASSDTTIGQQFDEGDSVALDRLWKLRLRDSYKGLSPGSFVLGPGDRLRISVPPIEPREVRVSEEDTIALPLLGDINVAGMTEKDLRAALASRMTKYRYHPEVAVFLEQAEDRQVAVLGAVKTPGRYMLASPSETLMTVISRAGGITDGAASRIFLIPAEPAAPTIPVHDGTLALTPISEVTDREVPTQTANAATRPSSGLEQLPVQPGDEPLAIDTSDPKSQRYLEIPARPGDVVLVPVAGEVTVQGWVVKPGSFKVTPKMSVLNAIAAAGGAQFTSSATLLREKRGGGKQAIALDLSGMQSGQQADLSVEGGDVIVVERSALGAIPYSVYFLAQHLGLGLPLY